MDHKGIFRPATVLIWAYFALLVCEVFYFSDIGRALMFPASPLYSLDDVWKIWLPKCAEYNPKILLYPQSGVLHNLITFVPAYAGQHLLGIDANISVRIFMAAVSATCLYLFVRFAEMMKFSGIHIVSFLLITMTNPLFHFSSISGMQQPVALLLVAGSFMLWYSGRQSLAVILLSVSPFVRYETWPIMIVIIGYLAWKREKIHLVFLLLLPTILYFMLSHIVPIFPQQYHVAQKDFFNWWDFIQNIRLTAEFTPRSFSAISMPLCLLFLASMPFCFAQRRFTLFFLYPVLHLVFNIVTNVLSGFILMSERYLVTIIPFMSFIAVVGMLEFEKRRTKLAGTVGGRWSTLAVSLFLVVMNFYNFHSDKHLGTFHTIPPSDWERNEGKYREAHKWIYDYINREKPEFVYFTVRYYDPLMYESCELADKTRLLYGPDQSYKGVWKHVVPYFDFGQMEVENAKIPQGKGIVVTPSDFFMKKFGWTGPIQSFEEISAYIYTSEKD
jgi:hypothetical protein